MRQLVPAGPHLNTPKSAPASWFPRFPETPRSCPKRWLCAGYNRALITKKIGPGPHVRNVRAHLLLPYRGQGRAADRTTSPYFFRNPGVVISRSPALSDQRTR